MGNDTEVFLSSLKLDGVKTTFHKTPYGNSCMISIRSRPDIHHKIVKNHSSNKYCYTVHLIHNDCNNFSLLTNSVDDLEEAVEVIKNNLQFDEDDLQYFCEIRKEEYLDFYGLR